MNANELADELADELEEHSQGPNLTQLGAAWFLEIATMLRQQQAEIEALKRGNEATALLNYNKGHEDGRNLVIPSPVKELTKAEGFALTDEEILEELLIPKSEWDSYKAHHCLKQIRAILRKAQEK